MEKLKPQWLEIAKKYYEKRAMASYAEYFFKHMNDEKHRRRKEWNEKVYRLDIRATKKLLEVINPFIKWKWQNGIYEIVNDDDNGKDEIIFSSRSIKEIFKKWKSYKQMDYEKTVPPYNKYETCRITVMANGKRLRLYYWYTIIGKDVDEFFGERNEILHQRLRELDEWVSNLKGRNERRIK